MFLKKISTTTTVSVWYHSCLLLVDYIKSLPDRPELGVPKDLLLWETLASWNPLALQVLWLVINFVSKKKYLELNDEILQFRTWSPPATLLSARQVQNTTFCELAHILRNLDIDRFFL
jgi:hypothetical protein